MAYLVKTRVLVDGTFHEVGATVDLEPEMAERLLAKGTVVETEGAASSMPAPDGFPQSQPHQPQPPVQEAPAPVVPLVETPPVSSVQEPTSPVLPPQPVNVQVVQAPAQPTPEQIAQDMAALENQSNGLNLS